MLQLLNTFVSATVFVFAHTG